jgi:hypothetical protein
VPLILCLLAATGDSEASKVEPGFDRLVLTHDSKVVIGVLATDLPGTEIAIRVIQINGTMSSV